MQKTTEKTYIYKQAWFLNLIFRTGLKQKLLNFAVEFRVQIYKKNQIYIYYVCLILFHLYHFYKKILNRLFLYNVLKINDMFFVIFYV